LTSPDKLLAATGRPFPCPVTPTMSSQTWSAPSGAVEYLRRICPPGDDEVHYGVTPAF